MSLENPANPRREVNEHIPDTNEIARHKFHEAARTRMEQLVQEGEITTEYAEAFLANVVGPIETGFNDDPSAEGVAFIENIVGHNLRVKKQIEEKIIHEIEPVIKKLEGMIDNLRTLDIDTNPDLKAAITKFREEIEDALEEFSQKLNDSENIISELFVPPQSIEDSFK